MEQDVMMLKEIGLTEYETKSYLTLLKLGIATAEQISQAASIPLPRVYDTLVELQKKGFVLISKGRPKKFKPNPPKKALKNFIENKKRQYENDLKYLKDSTNKLEKNLSKIEPQKRESPDWNVWSTKERKNIQKFIQEQEMHAKNEILIFSGDISWLPDRLFSIKKAIKNGVKIRCLASDKKTEELVKNVKLAKKLGIKVKKGYSGLLRGSIIDDKIAAIALKGSDLPMQYELVIFNSPVFVETFKENFTFWWKKLNI